MERMNLIKNIINEENENYKCGDCIACRPRKTKLSMVGGKESYCGFKGSYVSKHAPRCYDKIRGVELFKLKPQKETSDTKKELIREVKED